MNQLARVRDLASSLKEDWCASFSVHQLHENGWALVTPFLMPDGDGFTVLIEQRAFGWRLTDSGVTASRAFADRGSTAAREARFRTAATLSGLDVDGWALTATTPDFPDAIEVAQFLRATMAAYAAPAWELSGERGDRYTQRLRDAIVDQLAPFVPNQNNWHPTQDAESLYRTDLRIVASEEQPVLIFGVGNDHRAGVAALSVHQYYEWGVVGVPVAAVKPTVGSKAISRLQDVVGDGGQVELMEADERFTIARVLQNLGIPTAA